MLCADMAALNACCVLCCPVLHRAREELRRRVNMSSWQDKPIVAVVSRLTPQKGVHLIKHAAYKVISTGHLLDIFSSCMLLCYFEEPGEC
jgi:glycogen synthase